jgi:hypothetical protein
MGVKTQEGRTSKSTNRLTISNHDSLPSSKPWIILEQEAQKAVNCIATKLSIVNVSRVIEELHLSKLISN